MEEGEDDRHGHWEGVYSAKAPGEVSWHQARPNVSLALIEACKLSPSSSILDVGGGASTLVDHLLDDGYQQLTVLDLSAAALNHARRRLGTRAANITWIDTDITTWRAESAYDLWHDRAVLHFLTRLNDQAAYARNMRAALKANGWAIIAGFAPGGPSRCSGLEIVQHDADSLEGLLGNDFRLIAVQDDIHRTPWQTDQAFRYHLFQRAAAF